MNPAIVIAAVAAAAAVAVSKGAKKLPAAPQQWPLPDAPRDAPEIEQDWEDPAPDAGSPVAHGEWAL